MTDRLGSTVIETTPEGNVVTHLVSRKYAKAFPAGVTDEDGNNPVKAAFGAAQGEVQGAVQGAQDGQRQALPAPIGSPEVRMMQCTVAYRRCSLTLEFVLLGAHWYP